MNKGQKFLYRRQPDLERFVCTDEGVKLTLNTEDNRIAAAE